MLMPKRVKHRKQHRGRRAGLANRGNYLDFGDFGIMALDAGWITSRQIEAARIAMTRHIKRGGQVWIRIFPDKPYTKKPLEQRMGKGKAPVEGWVAVVKPGRIMFEMAGPSEEIVKEAMRLAQHKLPIRTKFVALRDFEKGAPLQSGQEHQLQQAAIWKERIEKRVRVIKVKTAKSEEEDAAAAAAPAMTEPALVGGETNE